MLNDDALRRLESLLAAEREAWASLETATQEHHAALLAGEAAGVERTLREQVSAVHAARERSEARVELTRSLGEALGEGAACSLGRLLGVLPGEREALLEAQAALRAGVERLGELNAANRRLSEHRLDLLQGDFAALQAMLAAATGGTADDGRPAGGSLLSLRA
jgi:hypothetical protein